MKKYMLYISFIIMFIFVITYKNLKSTKKYCIDYPIPVVVFPLPERFSLIESNDSLIIFNTNSFILKSEMNLNYYGFVNIENKTITKLNTVNKLNKEICEANSFLNHKLKVSNESISEINTFYEDLGRSGKMNSQLIFLKSNGKIIQRYLMPIFNDRSIYLIYQYGQYLIIESSNIYNGLGIYLYVYNINDFSKPDCKCFLEESINAEKDIPPAIVIDNHNSSIYGVLK